MAMATIDTPANATEDSKPENTDVSSTDESKTKIPAEVILSRTILVIVVLNNLLMFGGTMYGLIIGWPDVNANTGNVTNPVVVCNQENDYCNQYCGLEPGDDDGDIVEESSWDWDMWKKTLEWLQVYFAAAHQLMFALFLIFTMCKNVKIETFKEPWIWKSFALTLFPLFMTAVFSTIRLSFDIGLVGYYLFEIICVGVVLACPDLLPFLENMIKVQKETVESNEALLKMNQEVLKANEDALRQLLNILRMNRQILHTMTKRGRA